LKKSESNTDDIDLLESYDKKLDELSDEIKKFPKGSEEYKRISVEINKVHTQILDIIDQHLETTNQNIEIGEADNLSRIDILERKLGIKPDPSLPTETRLQNIEKRFGLDEDSKSKLV